MLRGVASHLQQNLGQVQARAPESWKFYALELSLVFYVLYVLCRGWVGGPVS